MLELDSSAVATDTLSAILGRRPRVLIGHPFLGRGGSEARVMWLIEALKDDCDLSVVTTGGWNLAELNEAYGTQVNARDASVRIAPFPRPLRRHAAAALRYGYYQRYCRRIAHDFDLCISAYNCTDWEKPGIQFIADFAWDPDSRAIEGGASPSFIYRDTPLRRAYMWWARKVTGPSTRDALREDLLVPTSQWAARVLAERFGARHVIPVYPFSHFSVPENNGCWAQDREEWSFLSLSRIAPEKRMEDLLDILRRVRQHGLPVRLYVAGHIPDDSYGRMIRGLMLQNSDWVTAVGHCIGERKLALLGRCRYGISARRQEMFGNSVTEMVRSGVIPFAYGDGGPAEILSHDALLFQDNAEAAAKIAEVLRNPELRNRISNHLRQRASLFSLENTIGQVREIVAWHLTHHRAHAPTP